MKESEIIKEQFNKGARNFDNWSVTQNEKMMQGLADFCELSKEDTVLDIACGTGGFSLYAASLADKVCGVDISEGMILVAKEKAKEKNINNIKFYCENVEDIKNINEKFSLVVSRSAFHHMKNYKEVFSDMVNHCKTEGKLCIQDIAAYDEEEINNYFEELEILIDKSHYKTYSKREFFQLFKEKNIKITALFESETELDLDDYINHLKQDEISLKNIQSHIEKGLENKKIAEYFFKRDNRLFWKRKVCTIVGEKSY
ncbi:class I SAM-dependent methyltransferase [Clostridium beijerinckii]|uniref:Ubiquinone/menaquinone biosynthesis C-methylase UbiE n=1 Tax=Clostridium beijerinckii TaxID=1520 RepID=A0AAE5H3H8_CLOBE|nr:class I SAM-dependent methyltransferase [Clostridium beijerinckii]ALB45651.1 class I SAM methyltransferase [Clostridium beijerinckii NRRL B-598]NSB14164.1 ubiquinone/menaquinone biosynthesis C-methylase UbiE [Clostridium beijerinckii]OOM30516.1 putative methyltransferase YcgJ [Clostridium beijerinckii]